MSSFKEFALAAPYPTLDIRYQNPEYARLLLLDYCDAATSELSASTSYMYSHLILADRESGIIDKIINSLRGVGIVEMHHLDLLGQAIRALGVDPRYRIIVNGRDQYWTAEHLPYQKDVNSVLTTAIQAEQTAIAQYQDHILKIDDPQIKMLLSRIIADEQLHIEIFNNLYQEYNKI